MAPDHLKANCALASLEPSVEQHRNRVTDTRQCGPSRKRFRREGTPTSPGSETSSGSVAYCFPSTKANVTDTLNRASENTGAFGVGRSID